MRAFIYVLMLLGALVFIEKAAAAPSANLRVDISGPVKKHTRDAVLALMLQAGPPPSVIELTIDTPGGRGDVMAEMVETMQALQARGHAIHCFIKRAYSAGFYIASACTKRFVLAESTFMWHNGWQMYVGPVNPIRLAKMLRIMAREQLKYDTFVRQTFRVSDEVFTYLRDKELILNVPTINKISPNYVTILPAAKWPTKEK
jgi:ATP-dependent protease ClpP protease subunit